MPGGFKLHNTDSQGDVTGKQKTFSILAATTEVITPGDLVRLAGTANAQGVADVEIAVKIKYAAVHVQDTVTLISEL